MTDPVPLGRLRPPLVPVSFLGMVLGLCGLGNGWRAAARVWGAPAVVGEVIALTGAAVWFLWLVLYGLKWARAREHARTEIEHPVLAFFAALVPVASLIASTALAPHLPLVARAVWICALVGLLAFAAWAVGTLWRGQRDPETTTPVLYMPTVGGGLVAAIACGTFGAPELGMLFFGLGFISWIVMESIIVHRLLMHTLPVSLRATLGIHLAPPAVACVAYLAVTEGRPDALAQMLFGYGVFQSLVMLRLLPWLRQQDFAPAAWAYTFGVSALPLAALRLIERGQTGPVVYIAPVLFVGANLIIGWIAIRTVILAVQGRLIPPHP